MNAGLSNLEFAVFHAAMIGESMQARARQVADLNTTPCLLAYDDARGVLEDRRWPSGLPGAFGTVLAALLAFADSHLGLGALQAFGHRVVHRGAKHIGPSCVTPALNAELKAPTALDLAAHAA